MSISLPSCMNLKEILLYAPFIPTSLTLVLLCPIIMSSTSYSVPISNPSSSLIVTALMKMLFCIRIGSSFLSYLHFGKWVPTSRNISRMIFPVSPQKFICPASVCLTISFPQLRQQSFSLRSSNICSGVLFIPDSFLSEMLHDFADCDISNTFDF